MRTPEHRRYLELLKESENHYLSYQDLLSTSEWQDKRNAIIKRDEKRCKSCCKSHFLQVHHTFYVLTSLPWDYPNDSLITLCNKCHLTLHKEHKVPIYKTWGGLVLKVTSCKRCHGVGRFSQYKHIAHGICFRCNGERYEELIGKGLWGR